MEGKREEAVSSWEEFFSLCGVTAPLLGDYEKRVLSWERIRAKDEAAAEAAFATRHDKSFWKKAPILHVNLLKSTAAGLAAGLVLLLAFTASTAVLPGFPLGFGGSLFAVSVLACVLCAGIGFCAKFLPAKIAESKMAAMEPELERVLQLVPAKYRNSFCLDALGDVYASYGIASFDRAVDVLDEHIANNQGFYVPFQALGDVKYRMVRNPSGEFVTDLQEGSRGGSDDRVDLSLPGMPADIESHVREGVEDADVALESLVGMDKVKKQIKQIRSRVELYGGAGGNAGNNFVFLGSPGTGKTEVARILTRILYDLGIIRLNRMVEVDGAYLKSPYVGGATAERTSAIINGAAKGGVLFLDEAYLLFSEKESGSAGREAVGVLLKAMEDMRDDLVVVLAGYEEGINRLLASNEGFSSRVKHKVYFDDYSAEELGEIFKLFMQRDPSVVKSIDDDAYAALVAFFDRVRNVPSFGNARAARNAFDRVLDVHADRFMDGEIPEDGKASICLADVEAYVAQESARLDEDTRNLMATTHVDESIISASELKARTFEGSANPEAELAAMVGLESVKDEMAAYIRRSEFYAANPDATEEGATHNIVLVGPAGTGKSTLARIITGYLHKAGVVASNRFVDVTGDFLKASFVGQTGKRCEATVAFAKGGVLFVDEAYLLASSGMGNDFGAEALGVLVNAVEKSPDNPVLLLAGYEDEMESLMASNEGLRSRMSATFVLEPYTLKELLKIFQMIAYRRGFSCDAGLWPPLAKVVSEMMGEGAFGNARSMRILASDVINKHIDRFSQGEVGEASKMVLCADDVV